MSKRRITLIVAHYTFVLKSVMKLPNLKVTRHLSDKVYDYLEEQILSGALELGARLPTEPELSQGFGVSRTVVREAMQKLKAQGLVVSKVGNGSFVATDSMSQIKKVFSQFRQIYANKRAILDYVKLRTIIEVECMRIVGTAQDPDCFEKLELIVDRMAAAKFTTMEEFARVDMEFHLTMAAFSGNIMFQAILEPLKEFSTRAGLLDMQRDDFETSCEITLQEHRNLLDMLKKGDVEEATSYFRDRMRLTMEFFGGEKMPVT